VFPAFDFVESENFGVLLKRIKSFAKNKKGAKNISLLFDESGCYSEFLFHRVFASHIG